MELPLVNRDQVDKLKKEIEAGKDQLLFKSEQRRLSPMFPLCVFPVLQQAKRKLAENFRKRASRRKSLRVEFYGDKG